MSTASGNANRKRPQKHQNRTAFKNDLHDKSRKIKTLNLLDVTGVCKRCKEIIQWKIKFKKYKPLTTPSKCVSCCEKAVKFAYHVLCAECARERNVCAKCSQPAEIEECQQKVEVTESDKVVDMQAMLKTFPERKRRTILRYMNKPEAEKSDLIAHIEDIISKMEKLEYDDDKSDFS